MIDVELVTLLSRIRDEQATEGDVERARAVLSKRTPLPSELVGGLFTSEAASDAAVLFGMFGDVDPLRERVASAVAAEAGHPADLSIAAARIVHPGYEPIPVAEAVRSEAGTVDVVEIVEMVLAAESEMAMVFDDALDLSTALMSEAGEIDLVGDVFASLGIDGSGVPASGLPGQVVSDHLEDAPLSIPFAAALSWEAGTIEISAAVASALGHEILPLSEAVHSEAGAVDVADAVFEALGLERPLPALAEAVRHEAGTIDIIHTINVITSPALVSGMLDGELSREVHKLAIQRLYGNTEAAQFMARSADLGRNLRGAVNYEVGEIASVWPEVAHAIGIADPNHVVGYDGALLAEAVRAEAGTADVTKTTMAQIRRMATVPVAGDAEELLSDVGMDEGVNQPFPVTAVLALAAAFLLFVGVQAVLQSNPSVAPGPGMQLASAGEIVVDELSYGDDSGGILMTSTEDDGVEGAVIIWVDEEAYL